MARRIEAENEAAFGAPLGPGAGRWGWYPPPAPHPADSRRTNSQAVLPDHGEPLAPRGDAGARRSAGAVRADAGDRQPRTRGAGPAAAGHPPGRERARAATEPGHRSRHPDEPPGARTAGRGHPTFRPNQILAVGGLPFPVLEGERARRVVDAVEMRLLTPLGLRSLAPDEPGYAPRYKGGVRQRDGAYHQGTVWPWLMGPFVEAWVRVRGGSAEAKREARERFLAPLRRHLDEAGLGHVSEIADAEPAPAAGLPVPGLVGGRAAAPRSGRARTGWYRVRLKVPGVRPQRRFESWPLE